MSTPIASELPSEIESHRSAIDEICARFGVRRLELFGSGATGRFDTARSDLDFLVEFGAARRIKPFLRLAVERCFEIIGDALLAGPPPDTEGR